MKIQNGLTELSKCNNIINNAFDAFAFALLITLKGGDMSFSVQPKNPSQPAARPGDKSELFAQAMINPGPQDADGQPARSTADIQSAARDRAAKENGERQETWQDKDGNIEILVTAPAPENGKTSGPLKGSAGSGLVPASGSAAARPVEVNLFELGVIPQPKNNIISRAADFVGNVVGNALNIPESSDFAKKAPMAAVLLGEMGIEPSANGDVSLPNDAAGGRTLAQLGVKAHTPGDRSMTPGLGFFSKINDASLKNAGLSDDFIKGFNAARVEMSLQGAAVVGATLTTIAGNAAGASNVSRPAQPTKVASPSQRTPPSMGGQTVEMRPGKGGYEAYFPKDGSMTTGGAGAAVPARPDTAANVAAGRQRVLTEGMVPYVVDNPRTPGRGDVTVRSGQLMPVSGMPQKELDEAAAFISKVNQDTYATPADALAALKNADQIYIIRNKDGAINGTATLTKKSETADSVGYYLGQVGGERGTGGDVMQRLIGDMRELAKNTGKEITISAYTNKPKNVYHPKDPVNTPGFYKQLGAQISDPDPRGPHNMVDQRPIDIIWKLSPDGSVNAPRSSISPGGPAALPGTAQGNVPVISEGRVPYESVNPKDKTQVSVRDKQMIRPSELSSDELQDIGNLIAAKNPGSYPNADGAIQKILKTDQVLRIHDNATGELTGVSALTKTGKNEWYLGQVAANRTGGDMMGEFVGRLKQMAVNEGQPMSIHFMTYDPANLEFYTKHGAGLTKEVPATEGKRPEFHFRLNINANGEVQTQGSP